MERFAIKIDKSLKMNMYNICRLCGIDNPDKQPIIDMKTLLGIHESAEDEPSLCKKIFDCVGVQVKKNDQMPQNVCGLCADKINDFHEYREMCKATNIQTRKLLGLPEMTIAATSGRKRKKNTDVKFNVEGESILGILGKQDDDDKKDILDNIPAVKKPRRGAKDPAHKATPNKAASKSKKSNLIVAKEEDKETIKKEDATSLLPPPTLPLHSSQSASQPATPFTKRGKGKMTAIVAAPKKPPAKSVKFAAPAAVSEPPLLTLKEPNERERKRELQSQKLEQKKRKSGPTPILIPMAKKLKIETDTVAVPPAPAAATVAVAPPAPTVVPSKCCRICSDSFESVHLLNTHYVTSHVPTVYEYGCSSCIECFKTLAEQKDHILWHTLSKTMYTCGICNAIFDKTQTFSRHLSHCSSNGSAALVLDDVPCAICNLVFPTKNLHDWHDCYMRTNGQCPRCHRHFVRKNILFKHAVQCNSTPKIVKPIEVIAPAAAGPVLPMVSLPANAVKSEPEAILDADITPIPDNEENNAHDDDVDDVDDDEQHVDNDGGNGADGNGEANDAEEYPVNHEDDHFGGESDESDEENTGVVDNNSGNTSAPALLQSVHGEVRIKTEPNANNDANDDDDDDDDVIIIEDTSDPIVIGDTSPIKKKDRKSKKHKRDKRSAMTSVDVQPSMQPLMMAIKQEPQDDTGRSDNHEIMTEPMVRIKMETIDDNNTETTGPFASLPNTTTTTTTTISAVTIATTVASKKKDKKKHKHKRNKRPDPIVAEVGVVTVKQEPIDDYEVPTSSSSSPPPPPFTRNDSDVMSHPPQEQSSSSSVHALVTLPNSNEHITMPAMVINHIKKEPNTTGYDHHDTFDPKVALNIKKEHNTCSSSSSGSGTTVTNKQPSLRLKITKEHGTLNAQIIPNQSKRMNKVIETATTGNALMPNASAPMPTASARKPNKSKNVYKKPALLAEKIRQEMMQRMAAAAAAAAKSNVEQPPLPAAEVDGSRAVPTIVSHRSQKRNKTDALQIPIIANVHTQLDTQLLLRAIKEERRSPEPDDAYVDESDEECATAADDTADTIGGTDHMDRTEPAGIVSVGGQGEHESDPNARISDAEDVSRLPATMPTVESETKLTVESLKNNTIEPLVAMPLPVVECCSEPAEIVTEPIVECTPSEPENTIELAKEASCSVTHGSPETMDEQGAGSAPVVEAESVALTAAIEASALVLDDEFTATELASVVPDPLPSSSSVAPVVTINANPNDLSTVCASDEGAVVTHEPSAPHISPHDIASEPNDTSNEQFIDHPPEETDSVAASSEDELDTAPSANCAPSEVTLADSERLQLAVPEHLETSGSIEQNANVTKPADTMDNERVAESSEIVDNTDEHIHSDDECVTDESNGMNDRMELPITENNITQPNPMETLDAEVMCHSAPVTTTLFADPKDDMGSEVVKQLETFLETAAVPAQPEAANFFDTPALLTDLVPDSSTDFHATNVVIHNTDNPTTTTTPGIDPNITEIERRTSCDNTTQSTSESTSIIPADLDIDTHDEFAANTVTDTSDDKLSKMQRNPYDEDLEDISDDSLSDGDMRQKDENNIELALQRRFLDEPPPSGDGSAF